MKILIIDTDTADKAIFSTALIDNLKSHYTSATIDFLVDAKNISLFKSHHDINEIVAVAKVELNSDKAYKRLISALSIGMKVRQNKYDMIFNTSNYDDAAVISLLSGAKIRVGIEPVGKVLKTLKPYSDSYELSNEKHIMEKKLDTMRVLGLKTSSKKPQLFASSDASFKIATVMSKYSMTKFIHLHLTSDKSGRAISAALIAKIIDFLENEKNISVIITSLHNVTEAQICLEALALAKSRPVSMIGSLDYDGLIALSKKSSMFIGVYSEVLHISASQNLPTIGLFGPDSAFLVGSWDGGCYESEYAEKNGKQNMGIHTVLQSKLECVPCEQNGCDNSGQSKCLEEDTFEMIKSEIESKLPK